MDKTVTAKEDDEGCIGFIKKKQKFIQFIRVDVNEWDLDIPIQDMDSKVWTGVAWDLPGLSTELQRRL